MAGLTELVGSTRLEVVASGGVGNVDHLRSLDAVEVEGRRIGGVIVGTAIYEGRVDVAEALAALR